MGMDNGPSAKIISADASLFDAATLYLDLNIFLSFHSSSCLNSQVSESESLQPWPALQPPWNDSKRLFVCVYVM